MAAIQEIANICIDCGKCVKECSFLQSQGTPGQISSTFVAEGKKSVLHESYSCNLCGLCSVVCPLGLECSKAFLEMRKQVTASSAAVDKKHRSICNYVKIGNSSLFSLDLIAEECDTVFFPGCTLSATRASTTEKTYNYLKEHIPHLGIVLDCCAKPALDLGRDKEFDSRFGKLLERLKQQGVKKLITACPSCYVTFKEHSPELMVEMVYKTLGSYLPKSTPETALHYSIHDACATRFEGDIHESVRDLVHYCGVEITEMKHSRHMAICCGEGGAASLISPEITDQWKNIRSVESAGRKVITYCAGCSTSFGRSIPNTHLLDLLFFPEQSANGKEKIRKAPFTYLSRLRLKERLIAREKNKTNGKEKLVRPLVKRLILLTGLILSVLGLRMLGVDQYLQPANMDMFLAACKEMPPIVFISLLAIAPVLLLPAFPFVIIAGLLYGQIWGLIYSLLGACLGASVSFLFSRYLASEWIVGRLSKTAAENLHRLVTDHGWKVVLVLRLIPVFPFTPLNYCLGLTGIRFSHYLAATFIGILPACIAFISFSGSLWQLFTEGDIGPIVFWSVIILVVMSLPMLGKKFLPASIKKP